MARGLGRGQGTEGKAGWDLAGPFQSWVLDFAGVGFYSKSNEDTDF